MVTTTNDECVRIRYDLYRGDRTFSEFCYPFDDLHEAIIALEELDGGFITEVKVMQHEVHTRLITKGFDNGNQ